MSYQVIARKWRPQTFGDVVGQSSIIKTLKNAIKLNRVAHAFLFTGPRGVGKTTTARILAKALNCEKGPTVEPCLECASCKEIASGTSIDVVEIDGASNRGINEIRELKEKINYRPSRDRFKIYIIDEVHMLTNEAFNALLKTLEEPPEHVKFIFATTEPHKIPRTILSRCQQYNFKLLSFEELFEHLKKILENENILFEEDAIKTIVFESEGSVRDAQSLLEQVIAFSDKKITYEAVKDILGLTDKQEILEAVKAVASKDVEKIVEITTRMSEKGADFIKFSLVFLKTIKDIISFIATRNKKSLMLLSEYDVEMLADFLHDSYFEFWFYVFESWIRAFEEISKSRLPQELTEVYLLSLTRKELTTSQKVAKTVVKPEQNHFHTGKKTVSSKPETKPVVVNALSESKNLSSAGGDSKGEISFSNAGASRGRGLSPQGTKAVKAVEEKNELKWQGDLEKINSSVFKSIIQNSRELRSAKAILPSIEKVFLQENNTVVVKFKDGQEVIKNLAERYKNQIVKKLSETFNKRVSLVFTVNELKQEKKKSKTKESSEPEIVKLLLNEFDGQLLKKEEYNDRG